MFRRCMFPNCCCCCCCCQILLFFSSTLDFIILTNLPSPHQMTDDTLLSPLYIHTLPHFFNPKKISSNKQTNERNTPTRVYNPVVHTLSTIVIFGAIVLVIAIPDAFYYLVEVALGFNPYAANDKTGQFLSLAWLASCVVSGVAIIVRDPSLLHQVSSINTVDEARSSAYCSSETAATGALGRDDETLKPKVDTTPRPIYAMPPSINHGGENGHAGGGQQQQAYNMFDPADLPPRLSEYANMVYSACEDLGNFFGFQDSSVRNQAEHLLVLLSNNRRYMNSHILPPALQPPSPIHALHAKVFSNYMKWCRYQGVPPHFSRMSSVVAGMSAPPSVASRVVDLVLFFCVWGEACNIRHMPECLWFLYHKMMEEYSLGMMSSILSTTDVGMMLNGGMYQQQRTPTVQQPRSLYAGHFLDFVVTPIYKIVSTVSVFILCA